MRALPGKHVAVIYFLLVPLLVGINGVQEVKAGELDPQQQVLEQQKSQPSQQVAATWRKTFKQARYNILRFSIAVNGYYNAMLFRGEVGDREKQMLIDGSIGARQSLNSIKECPEEYKEAREIYNETYENLRKMEIMAENRGVAHRKFEEQKKLKKKVDELIDELEERLNL